MQIGDLSRRVGVRVDTLRAWERRYGLLQPQRSTGGFRLYSAADEATVRAMLEEIERGFPPSQAAKLALSGARSSDRASAASRPAAAAGTGGPEPGRSEAMRDELARALRGFDGARAHALFDRMLGELTVNAVLRDVVLPCLRQVGDAWARGDVTVAEEHFASQLIRERLLGLARDWDRGDGPRALLACPTGERHDIGLICFGLALARSGWRIIFLGADTPADALLEAAQQLAPDVVVLVATAEDRFASIVEPLRALAEGHQVALAGPGATPEIVRATGTVALDGGPVSAALALASRRT